MRFLTSSTVGARPCRAGTGTFDFAFVARDADDGHRALR
jgi:hypothetical protein